MKRFSKFTVFVLGAALMAFLFASCNTNVSGNEPNNKTAGSISYAIETVDKTIANDTFTNELTKTGNGTVTYSSSNEDVATVDDTTGKVTIKGVGTTTITATVADSSTYTYETKTASYTLTVTTAVGSISYATETVDKTIADDAFTNELTKTGDGTVTYSSSNIDVATVDDTTGEVTIVGAGTTTITATVEDSDTYTYGTKTTSYMLTVPYFGTKAPTEAKVVGDIVFNDGSATPYADGLSLSDAQKNAAIAIIFYKGTDCNNDGDTTFRTLGVGLKHNRSGLAWCISSASAYSKNITTIQSDDKNGSDNLEQIGAFKDVSVYDTAVSTRYPAFYFAKNYSETATNLGTSYKDDWYLPSIAELNQIYKNGKGTNKVFDIDSAIGLCGGDQFGTSDYWSSSQIDDQDVFAFELEFSKGRWLGNYKTYDNNSVCAVREF